MKRKILALGLLSLCALTVIASDSQAFFGLFNPYSPYSFCNRHNRYVTQITCRPYNAFTPICWGNLVCDGCNPSPCGVASGCLPLQFGAPPWACGSGCAPYMGGGHDFSRASDMPMPDIRTQPSFTPPMPMPLPSGPGVSMTYPPAGVAQANYNPMYMPPYPNYYMPTYYNPYQQYQPMPYYWYQGGR